MRNQVFLTLCLFLLAVTSPALADEWVVDPSHSDVEFSVRHMMVSNTKGEFKKFSGTAHIDDADLNKSRVNFEIDVASIDTDDAKRDEHLKGPDFFNVAKHPKITSRRLQAVDEVAPHDGGRGARGQDVHGARDAGARL